MIQEKTTRKPHTLRVAGGCARCASSDDAVRTYLPQVGYFFSFLIPGILHRKNNENEATGISERKKIPSPLSCNHFSLIGSPCTGQKKRFEQQSFYLSLVQRPPVTRPLRHRLGPGKAFVPLCHCCESCHSSHFKLGANRGTRSPARQCWYSDCVALSVNFSLVAKISTA